MHVNSFRVISQDNMAKGDVFIQSRKPYMSSGTLHEISYANLSEHGSLDEMNKESPVVPFD